MKVLHITSELDGGGVDRLLYDYCSRMIPDINFDFVVTSTQEGILEKPLKILGCRIFHVVRYRENSILHNKEMAFIIKSGNYDIVHDHSGFKAFINLKIAKQNGVSIRIAHAHQAYMTENWFSKVVRIISERLTRLYATNLFACGIDAAKWMWGKLDYSKGRVNIMRNAICLSQFSYSNKIRCELRNSLGLHNKLCIGSVARFTYQKNHNFLVDIFCEIKKIRKNSVLLLVGGGELERDIKRKIAECGLTDSVLFLGVRNDVYKLMSAMDVFILPSKFEGLPVTLVEAQACALPCIVSDNITREINITPLVKYLSINDSPEKWAHLSIDMVNQNNNNRYTFSSLIASSGYDIETEADRMKLFYLSCKR